MWWKCLFKNRNTGGEDAIFTEGAFTEDVITEDVITEDEDPPEDEELPAAAAEVAGGKGTAPCRCDSTNG